MKNREEGKTVMKNGKLKGILIIVALLIVGVIIMVFNKFAFNVNYSKNVRLEIYLGKNFEINDILEMTSEIYKGQNVIVRKAGDYLDTVAVTLKEVSDEQNEEFINKINEKYETSFAVSDIKTYNNSNVKGTDLMKPYVASSVIVAVITLAYFIIRYKKLGLVKAILGPIMVGARNTNTIFILIIYNQNEYK